MCALWLGIGSTFGAGLARDSSFIASQDQSEQRYVLVLPEAFDSAQPHDLLLCLHGHGADRWQYVREPRGETRAARTIAARYGMIFVSPDYRAPTSWMGPAAETDLVQLIGELKKQYDIRRVILSGASMGAASTLTFTALHPELVDGVVALNGHANHLQFTNFHEAIQAAFGGTKEAVPDEYKKRSPEFFPERFTMPVAITAGGKDTIVPPESVLRLGRTIQKHNPRVCLDFQDARGHETEYTAALSAYEFVMRSLAPGPIRVSVLINGKSIPPSPGSAAGVWFYTREGSAAQVLLTGHAAVPGGWRLTAVLDPADEVRLSFFSGEPGGLSINFQEQALSTAVLRCRSETNALVINGGTIQGAVRLTHFTSGGAPLRFDPERRAFSRAPVPTSPDPHPAIADAMIEWDWRMQGGKIWP